MPFRFTAAASAKGAKGLAQQASRRLSLLANTGDATAPVAAAARGGGLGRQLPAAAAASRPTSSSSSVAVAATSARTTGFRGAGRDTAGAIAAPAGQTRQFTSPAGVTATVDCYRCPGSGHQSSSIFAVNPGGSGSGGRRCRGLATTPAPAATEDALEDAGANGFVGMPAAGNAGGGQQHVGPATAEAVLGAGPASAEDGAAETSGGGGVAVDGGADTATAVDASGSGTSDLLEDSNKKLRGHAKRGEGGRAAALIASMREAGVTPNDRSYTSAINACNKGREPQWEQALALLRETATVGGGVAPNAFHYTAAIKTCGNAKQWKQVISLKAEMDSLGIIPGPPYYHWAFKSVVPAKHGDEQGGDAAGSPPSGWEAVKDLVTDMSEKGVVPNINTFALVRQAKSRLTPRSGDSGSDERSGEVDTSTDGGEVDGDGGDVADAELEWAFGVLRGIDGAPEPRVSPTLTAMRPERPPAKTNKNKQQKPTAVDTDVPQSGGGGGKSKKVREKSPPSASSSSTATASAPSKGDDQPGGPASLGRYNKELRVHAKRGEGDKAAALIASMREAGVAPTVKSYTSAINACKNGKESQWKQALALLREAAAAGSGVAPNAFHYTAAVKTCGNANQWRLIPALMAEMESRGIRPDAELYNWAIKTASGPRTGAAIRATLTRGGGWQAPEQQNNGGGGGGGGGRSGSPSFGWEAATGLLRDMSAKGVAPTSITYTLVISACQKDRQPERALAMLREMQELAAAAATKPTAAAKADGGPAEEEEDPAVAGDAAVVEEGAGLNDGGAGGGGSAAAVASSVVAPNVFHYSSVMSAFAEQPGGWKCILALIKEMEAAGVAPNAYTYNSAMMACGRDGRWAEAVAVFRRMPKRGVVPDEVSFLAVIEACRQGGQWALAVALLREMSTTPIVLRGPTTTTTSTMMISPTVEAYTAALTACGNAGQWEVAVGLLREVTDGDAVAAAAAAAAVDGGAGSAAAAADEEEDEDESGASDEEHGEGGRRRKKAEAAAAEFKPVPLKPDLFLYNAAIEACGNAGQWQRALKLLSEISEIGLSPSVVSYNSAIAACARADQWEKAVALLDEMRVVGLVPVSSTFLPAIEACQRAGEGRVAYALTKERDETQRRMKGHPEFRSMKRRQRTKKQKAAA